MTADEKYKKTVEYCIQTVQNQIDNCKKFDTEVSNDLLNEEVTKHFKSLGYIFPENIKGAHSKLTWDKK